MTRLLLAYSAWTQTSQGNALAPTACGTSSATVYHPAMGGIASSLLTQLPEENVRLPCFGMLFSHTYSTAVSTQAFWALTWISDRLMPQYFSTNHCIGLQVQLCVLII